MADFIFNIAKGRVVEYYNRVKGNDPTNSALIIVVIDANGDTDATMKDRDELAALLGGTANEVTNTNYARKTLTDAELAALPAPDDTTTASISIFRTRRGTQLQPARHGPTSWFATIRTPRAARIRRSSRCAVSTSRSHRMVQISCCRSTRPGSSGRRRL